MNFEKVDEGATKLNNAPDLCEVNNVDTASVNVNFHSDVCTREENEDTLCKYSENKMSGSSSSSSNNSSSESSSSSSSRSSGSDSDESSSSEDCDALLYDQT
ncbi:hypothetical protein PGB90_005239 [Kerria lacca]